MRAIVVTHTGGPEVLTINDVETPEPGPRELLIEVANAGVNFIDVYFRTGKYPIDLPYIPGKEGSGRVVGVGEEVTEFAIGDRVAWAMGNGAYAEFVTIDEKLAVPVPEHIDDAIAAASMLQGLTAHYLAHSIVNLEPDDTVLIHAGAGGVGLLLTQLLSRRGVRVITTTSTADKARLSRAAGADTAITYDDFDKQVLAATDGEGVRVVFDGVGKDTFDRSLDSLRTRGTLILFGASSGPVPPIDPQVLNANGSLMLTRPNLSDFIHDRVELLWRANDLFAAIANGLDIHIDRIYELSETARAHEDLESRRTQGKLLLSPK